MRNGSMVVLKAGYDQGYDSRNASYKESASIKLPYTLDANLSMVSTISNTTLPVDNFCKNIMWDAEKKSRVTLKVAAVLTSLKQVPPADAFRPPFVGKDKPLYRAKDIQWVLLPKLKSVGEVPSWDEVTGYFSKCWIDHLLSWEQQEFVPYENMPNYGREHARVVSIGSLMTMLDVPREKKEKLVIGFIQHGIDLFGTAKNGGFWNEGGGHSSGRKWPIIYASLMLKDPSIYDLPASAIFQEDTQTYYGKGWFGQDVLYWMVQHHGRRSHYEEKQPEEWEQWDKTTESYRQCCNGAAWVGEALSARLMKAVKIWGHDAFFDYVERWMRPDDPFKEARRNHPRPSSETKANDDFVTDMWKSYRASAPEQPKAGNDRMWVWKERGWEWLPNPKEYIAGK
jgi:hypothetical protein